MSEQIRALHDQNLIVLSAGRSGSSLLVNYLNSNRQIHCHGEILNSGHTIYGNVEGKSREELIQHVASFFQKQNATYVGAKFLTHQFEELDITLGDVLKVLRSPKVIALYRRNLLETYVSLLIAQQTDTWYSSKVVNDASVTLDLRLFHEFAEIQRRRWQDSMRKISGLCDCVHVSYEDLVSNPRELTTKIFSFLDLPATDVHSESVKQNPGDLREKISNYDALPAEKLASATSARLELGVKATYTILARHENHRREKY